jgi:hypothetical protein
VCVCVFFKAPVSHPPLPNSTGLSTKSTGHIPLNTGYPRTLHISTMPIHDISHQFGTIHADVLVYKISNP